ncbi:lachesin-like [Asterias rubens]|uniref:lachesin-like n=1 Tax=Asterias rubens TaxID=7604 RepID=UPI00145514EC|nr:lachesin-like [Asterias rubens]
MDHQRVLLLTMLITITVPIITAAKRQDIVIGSTTFSLTERVQKCMEMLRLRVRNSANPGGDMQKCLRQMTTTRAPNETYFNNLDSELLVAEEGSTALLECEIVNLGNKDVSWKRRGKTLSHMETSYLRGRRFKLKRVNSTFSIRIEGVVKSDAGDYKCQVLSRTSTIERIIRLEVPSLPNIFTIDPSSSPYFIPSDPNRRYFNSTSDAILFCNATGSPEPNVTWERVDGNSSNGRLGLWGDTVSLRNVSAGDAGTYNCTASNGVGDVELSVEVVVQYKPVVVSPTPMVRAGRDDYVTIRCNVKAVPKAEIVWKRNKVVLQNNGRGILRNGMQSVDYVLVKVMPDTDYGNYSCVASNMMGTSQMTVELHGRPVAPAVTSQAMGRKRHAYTLSWQPGTSSSNQKVPISAYVIMFRGWWIEMRGTAKRIVFSHDTPLREVVRVRGDERSYSYIIRDLRPNTTYELSIYGRNQYGNGDVSMFTFYTTTANVPTTTQSMISKYGIMMTTKPGIRLPRRSGAASLEGTGQLCCVISSLLFSYIIINK